MHLPRTPVLAARSCALAEALEGRLLLSVSLVSDIYTGTADSDLSLLGAEGSTLYLQTWDPTHTQLTVYQTDGTDAGTQVVQPSWPLPATPNAILPAGPGKVFLVIGNQIWITSGSWADAQLVKEVPSIANYWFPFVTAGGKLYFAAASGNPSVKQLWVSDGTAAGTVQLTDGSSDVTSIVPVGNKVAVAINSQTSNGQVLVSDGTAAGTQDLVGIIPGPVDLTSDGTTAYFAPNNAPGLWQTDGTRAGTFKYGIPTFPITDLISPPGGTLFFSNANSSTPTLYSLSGVTLTALGTAFANPGSYAWINNRLIFVNETGQTGFWSTDGTRAGTFLLKGEDINSKDLQIAQAGSLAYFQYDDGAHGGELWKTDGTPQGTAMVKDINLHGSGLGPFDTGSRVPVGQELYFPANDGFHGLELWKTDGTNAGTVMVKDLNTSPASSNPSYLSDVNGKLYFGATDEYGTQPWASDGTAAGTQRLGVLSTQDFFNVGPFVSVNGQTVFMSAYDQLWSGDGSAAGSSRILSLNDATQGTIDRNTFVVSGGKLFFFVQQQSFPVTDQLWVTDGTAAGTTMLKTFGGIARNLVALPGGGVEFLASTGSSAQVMKSDGTAAGTVTLGDFKDFGTGQWTATIQSMAAFLNGDYYLGVEFRPLPPIPSPFPPYQVPPQFTPYYQLWRLGPSGDSMLVQVPIGQTSSGVANVNGTVIFAANGGLYRSDGTPAGTTRFTDLPSGVSIYFGYPPNPTPVVSGNRAFFAASTSAGYQFLVADGTAGGTRLLPAMPQPVQIVAADGSVFFDAQDGDIWASDGTPDGTGRIASFLPIGPNPTSTELAVSGNRLYFAATDAAHGRELWSADLTGSISGSVFNDANHNGLQDPGENGLAGVTVYLDANNNGVLDPGETSLVTGSDGSYSFDGLARGGATVRQVLPTGWRRTTPLADSASPTVHTALSAAGPVFGDVQVSTVPMNFDYLLTLAQHFGQQGTFATGDVTGDDTVNFDDLLLLAQNYGRPLSATTASAAAADNSLLLKKSRSPVFVR